MYFSVICSKCFEMNRSLKKETPAGRLRKWHFINGTRLILYGKQGHKENSSRPLLVELPQKTGGLLGKSQVTWSPSRTQRLGRHSPQRPRHLAGCQPCHRGRLLPRGGRVMQARPPHVRVACLWDTEFPGSTPGLQIRVSGGGGTRGLLGDPATGRAANTEPR